MSLKSRPGLSGRAISTVLPSRCQRIAASRRASRWAFDSLAFFSFAFCWGVFFASIAALRSASMASAEPAMSKTIFHPDQIVPGVEMAFREARTDALGSRPRIAGNVGVERGIIEGGSRRAGSANVMTLARIPRSSAGRRPARRRPPWPGARPPWRRPPWPGARPPWRLRDVAGAVGGLDGALDNNHAGKSLEGRIGLETRQRAQYLPSVRAIRYCIRRRNRVMMGSAVSIQAAALRWPVRMSASGKLAR